MVIDYKMDAHFNVTACVIYGTNYSYDCLFDVEGEIEKFLEFENYVRIIIPIIFGLIVITGLGGNLLVICSVLCNQQMRSTTNILIVSLAFADLFFIIFCVPFTATGYVLPYWPFGNLWCKVVHFVIFVSAYISIYTLVLMSLDRYLAVVHPISSLSIRTERNAYIIVAFTWVIILLCHIPLLVQYGVHEYLYYGEERSACMNLKGLEKQEISQMFFASFLAFGYLLPLSLICVLYGLMLKRLLNRTVPGGSQRAENVRTRKRVTRMVVIVVVIFAICWLPIQIIFMLQQFGSFPTDITSAALQMCANCLAYMNSCVNPILYAFLSDNFRKGFKKFLSCSSVRYKQMTLVKTNKKNNNMTSQKSEGAVLISLRSTVTALQNFSIGLSNGSSFESVNTRNNCAQTEL